MKKKHLVIVGVIILSAIVILGLYQTFALSGDITKDTSGYYNVTVTDGTTVIVPADGTKTVYYKLTNTNKGIVKYGIGYSGTNITVKYYTDTTDPVTGTVDYGKSKYIKLSVENTGTTSSTATLSTILGYENGGDLIVPSGVTLVTKMTNGYKGLAKLIAEDTFAPNSTVTNNSVTYQYDTTHSLMKDIGGNIRYYGTNAETEEVPAYKSSYTNEMLGTKYPSVDSCLEDLAYYNVCSPDVDGYEKYGYSDQATCENNYDIGKEMFGFEESFTYNESKTKFCSGTIKEYVPKEINNYIYFNCSDYSNQSSSTCETWHIIGVFDGKVKLIRGSKIGLYPWDNKDTSTGAETNDGKNDWTDARLMKLLNPGYESEPTGGSLYYNSKSGNCYLGLNNATEACDFTSIGIKNAETRNLITNTTYYLGGMDSDSKYPNQIYEQERGGAVYTGRPTSWTGKIALPYPSDYVYATDLSKCSQDLYAYNSTCTSNNWINTIISENSDWLLTPSSDSADRTWYATSLGYVHDAYSKYGYGITPVLYLNANAKIKSGTGTSTAPYQLSI